MLGFVRFAVLAAICVVLVPAAAKAQGSITGVVKDTSGAVLPGVTVEAASPALIEKVRSVVTDGAGQYRIENLRPGVYTVTFTLAGFSTIKREGIELTGNFTASVNADLRVGALEETITVTGETPIVDVQSTSRQQVLDQDLVDSLPANRSPGLLGALVPGMNVSSVDVGGNIGNPFTGGSLTIHGSRTSDFKIMVNGIATQTLETGPGGQGAMNMAVYQETVVESSSVSAEQATGGAQVNLIPREGGNDFSGSFIGTFATEDLVGSNFTDELKNRGLRTPDRVKKIVDVNPAYGGPVRRDRLWFFTTGRYLVTQTYVPIFYNANAFNPDLWTYAPDTNRPAYKNQVWKEGAFRVTWQAATKHKVAFATDQQYGCPCAEVVSATISPEAAVPQRYYPGGSWSVDWTSPLTNRLLIEGSLYRRFVTSRRFHPEGPIPDVPREASPDEIRAINAARLAERWIGVTDQASGIQYRATTASISRNQSSNWATRASVAYITGAHAFKVGFINNTGHRESTDLNLDAPLSYRFNNGVPNQLTMFATPVFDRSHQDLDLGIYAQDRWTTGRVTLSYAVRYDHYKTSFPSTHVGPAVFAPTRNFSTQASQGVNWKDVTPRMGAAYDLFGSGKTALKISLSKYLAGQSLVGTGPTLAFGDALNPVQRLVRSTARSWTDANRNFFPDCDLLNPAANGECGQMTNRDFGSTRPGNSYDPEILEGWGHRAYNWQFSTGVQHELLPRVSVDVGYFRRWYGNFIVTDDRALTAADFDTFSIPAPSHPDLEGGGGYAVSGLYDIKPARFGTPADNLVTFADNFGKQIEHWNGVDVSLSARSLNGLMLIGGVSTGRTSTDNCEVAEALPEVNIAGTTVTALQFCHVDTAFRTQAKLVGTYTIPRIDVQISGTWQNLPGAQLSANYNAPNAVVLPSLGRPLAGNNANVTVNVVEPGTMFGERRDQIDLRFGKIIRFGRTRTTVSVDVYNALNANPVLTENASFAVWRQPTGILPARFAKFALQFDF
jgi:hypothetical protein